MKDVVSLRKRSQQWEFYYLEVPLAGMGAAGESQGQCCTWGLHCLSPVSYGISSASHSGSALKDSESRVRVTKVLSTQH